MRPTDLHEECGHPWYKHDAVVGCCAEVSRGVCVCKAAPPMGDVFCGRCAEVYGDHVHGDACYKLSSVFTLEAP